MNKPIIIMLCGPSASGKDSTAIALKELIKDSKRIVADTTRPPRENEQDGIHYNFITLANYLDNVFQQKYLETTSFKGWYYATSKDQFDDETSIYVGVFNPHGAEQMLQHKEFIIVPVLLDISWYTRLKRSYLREKHWSWEYIRRMWADFLDFRYFKKLIKNHLYLLVLKNFEGPEKRAGRILSHLMIEKLI